MITNQEDAKLVWEYANLVFKHYVFANRPARLGNPPAFADKFSAATPGMCDSAAAFLNELLPASMNARNFNVIAPKRRLPNGAVYGDDYTLSGHTVTEVRLQRGAVLLDSMYGFILISSAPAFTNEVFAIHAYEQTSLFDSFNPTTSSIEDLVSGLIYPRLAREESSVAISGELMQPMFPRMRIPRSGLLLAGKTDGSSADTTQLFNGWGNHIGYWYEPTRARWRFAPEIPGRYAVTYNLLGGENPVLVAPLSVDVSVSEATLVGTQFLPNPQFPSELIVTFDATDKATVIISSKSISARNIDSVRASRLKQTPTFP